MNSFGSSCKGSSEAIAPHGLGQKSSDLSAIPLCGRHHRTGDDSYHRLGPRKFAQVHQLDIRAIVARLSAKPFIGYSQDEPAAV